MALPVLRIASAALCVAALAAVLAILSGDFSDGDLRVIGTSVLVALASATAGSGLTLRARATPRDELLGSVVVAASVLAFALVTFGMWVEVDADGFWQLAGAAAIVALDGSHACFVLARRRAGDPAGARLATEVAVWCAGISATMGLLAVAGLADDGPWQPLAVVLVVQLLATALAPLRRRMAPDGAADHDLADLPTQLHAIADALEEARSPAEVREQARRLRAAARRAGP